MAITYVGRVWDFNASGTTKGNISLIVPSNVVEGDVLIAGVHMGTAATVTPPSGWSAINSERDTGAANLRASMWYKIATSSDAGQSQTWAISATSIWGVLLSALRGVDTSSGDPVHASNGAVYTSTNPATGPTVTTTVQGCMILTFCASRGSTTTTPSYAATNGADSSGIGPIVSGTVRGGQFGAIGADGGVSTRSQAQFASDFQGPGTYGFAVQTSAAITERVMFTVALPALPPLGVAQMQPTTQAVVRNSRW
ncbi:hypothetical protein [Streptomyces sp. I8-5]|uniref:hypothetical protein n=1 Tax=Streptomyces sp. I8-5 TaxID=3104277 RepID=UPI00386359D2